MTRTRHFGLQIVIAGLALWGLLGLGAGSSRAQVGVDGLPCSSRATALACLAECDDVPGSNNFVFDCTCLFDNGLGDPQNLTCPVGTTCCWNMPCEKWTAELQCVRGGGGSFDDLGVATPKNCTWNADAQTCACTPPLVHSNYTIGDFIMPTGIVLNAPFDCRCPFTTDEQWLRLDVCNPPGVSKLGIKLNFAKPSLDSIGLKGTLAVPADFSVAGATLEVSIGGVVKTFTLDAKGKATVGTDKAQLTVKAKKGVVAPQDAKLSVKLTKGSFASSLVDEGLVDETVTNVAVTMPVEIKLNDTMYASAQPQTYKAKAGKTGSAK